VTIAVAKSGRLFPSRLTSAPFSPQNGVVNAILADDEPFSCLIFLTGKFFLDSGSFGSSDKRKQTLKPVYRAL
jgi:hypothetical protein